MRTLTCLVLASASLIACGSDDVDSDEEARRAYLGLDVSMGKALTLGFDGFNAAENANIPDQQTTGIESGTLIVGGKVDAGTSDNKVMTLSIGMVDYSDGEIPINDDGDSVFIVYATDADPLLQPVLDMKLQNFPNGTLEGTLVGTYFMTGDIEGEANLNLVLTGETMDDGTGATVRKPGTIHITGTLVNSDDGTFDVDVTL
jgi:hypothetical protein